MRFETRAENRGKEESFSNEEIGRHGNIYLNASLGLRSNPPLHHLSQSVLAELSDIPPRRDKPS